MSRFAKISLDVKQNATGAGVASIVEDYDGYIVQIVGLAGGATIRVEATIDGSNFVPMCDVSSGAAVNNTGTTFAADGIYRLNVAKLDPEESPVWKMRTNRIALGTGNPVVTLGGRNLRSQ